MSRYYKVPVKVGSVILPGALNTNILMRAFKEKELLSIWGLYERAKKTSRASLPPSEMQVKLAEEYLKGTSVKDIAKKYHLKNDGVEVYYAIRRVAMYEFMNKDK